MLCFEALSFDLEENAMFDNMPFKGAVLIPVCLAVWSIPNNASAITVEVAKKCNALTAKAFPPRELGNPAAGSAKGSGQSQREYFSKCVANGGSMDNDAQGKK
jgi:hypothetical protein